MAHTTAQNAAQTVVEQLDPTTLLLDRNVRLDPQVDKTFLGVALNRPGVYGGSLV